MLRRIAGALNQRIEIRFVAGPVAGLAVHVDVGQEVHFDLDRAVARAHLAASTLHVEREPSLLVPADLRLLGLGEELADLVEDPRVRRGVRPRRAPDRLLVNGDDLVDVLDPKDGVVLGDSGARASSAGSS